MDIASLEQSSILVLSNIFLIFILFFKAKPAIRTGYVSPGNRRLIWGLILLFCLFSFWGLDWFGYLRYFTDIERGDKTVAMEDIYIWLSSNLCSNYIIFRLWVWGSALFLFYRTIMLFDIKIDIVLFFFVSIFLIYFAYARATLAMAMMFCGFAEICVSRDKSKSHLLLGTALVVFSYFLHKTSPFGIIAVAFTLLVSKLQRKSVISLVVIFPLLVYFFSLRFSSYIDLIAADETNLLNDYITTGSSYLNAGYKESGLGALLQRILERSLYYFIFVLCGLVLNNTSIKLERPIRQLLLLTFVLVLLSTVFAFGSGLNTKVLYVRCLRYAQIPATLSIAYIYCEGYYPKLTKYAMYIGICSTAYSLLYVFYNLI